MPSAEFIYTLNSGVHANVQYSVIDDGEDVKITHISAPGFPDINIPVDDDEMEAIGAAALEMWFFR